ncbi:MAG TPA: 50S ribosomal protein L21 [Gaiellaceae bacterium]|jgi:large subunit ribosomal protein L21|nr:50S ribosomal protein L21 [Gaiellaceae bacterium]
MDYAIIRLGGKQYRVREGETLVVDRVKAAEGESFTPDVLLGDSGAVVTATVVAHERGPKIRIAKVKRRTGYRRHNGFRAATSRLEISLGGAKPKAAAKKTEAPKAATPKATAPTVEAPKAEAPKAAAPKAEAPKAAAAAEDHVKGMPHGYEDLTVAQVKDGAKTWNRPMLEAALAYENAHAQRKGAVAALESALEAKGESS